MTVFIIILALYLIWILVVIGGMKKPIEEIRSDLSLPDENSYS